MIYLDRIFMAYFFHHMIVLLYFNYNFPVQAGWMPKFLHPAAILHFCIRQ